MTLYSKIRNHLRVDIIVNCNAATFIEQGEPLEFYSNKFPEESPILGIFTWKWIVYPGFDHMWTSPVFLGLLVLLASSLMACSYTTQIPLVKIARRYLLHS